MFAACDGQVEEAPAADERFDDAKLRAFQKVTPLLVMTSLKVTPLHALTSLQVTPLNAMPPLQHLSGVMRSQSLGMHVPAPCQHQPPLSPDLAPPQELDATPGGTNDGQDDEGAEVEEGEESEEGRDQQEDDDSLAEAAQRSPLKTRPCG